MAFAVTRTFEMSEKGLSVKGIDGAGADSCKAPTLSDRDIEEHAVRSHGIGYRFHVRRQKRRKNDLRTCIGKTEHFRYRETSQLAVPDSIGQIFSVRLLLYCVQKRGFPFVTKGCSIVLYGRTVATAKSARRDRRSASAVSDTVFAARSAAQAAIIAACLNTPPFSLSPGK